MAERAVDIITRLERTYAQALLELAAESGDPAALDAVVGQMAQLGELFEAQPDLARVLCSRSLSARERAAVLERLGAAGLHERVLAFLQVVNRKGRLDRLAGIIRAFAHLVDERAGVVWVGAHLAQAPDEAGARNLAESLGRALGRPVRLRTRVDAALIGGLKLRVGDRLLDGSVATQLRLMHAAMVAAGRDRARRAAAAPR